MAAPHSLGEAKMFQEAAQVVKVEIRVRPSAQNSSEKLAVLRHMIFPLFLSFAQK